jgi:hypothetical protein
MYADDVANVAGLVATACGATAVITSETGVGAAIFGSCYAVSEAVSLSASTLHTAVTCADLDKYCRNSAAATGLNWGSMGLATGIMPKSPFLNAEGDTAAIRGFTRWVGGVNASFWGWLGGISIDTRERPSACPGH